ncbi:MAG: hypothetical protein R6W31_16835 [Bacteroidales bacterium]
MMKHFSGKNTLGFTFRDVTREFPGKNPVFLSRILAEMVEKGMLFKITRGYYHIIPIHANPETYVPDRHQVAKYIMQDKEYYIGYASALEIHGIRLQTEAMEFVVTKKQMEQAIKRFGDITCQFIQHDETRFFGYSSIWINQLEKAMVSDLEKTIVDISAMPQLCGGIIEVGSAIFHAKDRTDHDKLFYYFARNMKKSAKKRFLFLTELLGLQWTIEHERMMEELGSSISLLDPGVPDQGRKRIKFGLKINVDPIRIREAVLHRKIS